MTSSSTGERRSGSYLLVFDGECEICRRSVRWIRTRDRAGLIEALPYQDPAAKERFAGVPDRAFERAIQLVSPSGVRFEGARAAEELLRQLRLSRSLSLVFLLPGARWVADQLYRWVARNRRRFGCGAHCSPTAGPPGDPGKMG